MTWAINRDGKLVARLPENLTRVFYSDNGSTAVEIALKMADRYWIDKDRARSSFLAFQGAARGDTVGTMSVNTVRLT